MTLIKKDSELLKKWKQSKNEDQSEVFTNRKECFTQGLMDKKNLILKNQILA